MPETIRLPAIGEVKTQYVWAGAALIVGIAGYAWWRAGQNGAAPAEDELFAGEGIDDGTQWPYRPGGSSTVDAEPQDPADLPPGTNDEWARRATDRLVDAGWDPQLVATVLGKYLGRQKLTTSEADLVRAAFALVGQPPNDPPPIVLVPVPPSPQPAPQTGLSAPTGFKVTVRGRTSLRLDWQPVKGATGYQVDIIGGTSKIVRWSSARFTGLKPATRYRLRVRARSGSKWGPWSSDLTVTTKK